MNEELKDIDLIDKYLNDDLSSKESETFQDLIENDPEFRKEVDVFRSIYQGIEERGDHILKKKLDSYYKQYLSENEAPIKPKAKQRTLFLIVSSIAASILVGAFFLFFNKSEKTPISQDKNLNNDKTEKVDTLKNDGILKKQNKQKLAQDGVIKKEVEKENNKPNNTPKLSLGGVNKLPAESVRLVNYPMALQYTFDGSTIVLFGDPIIPSLQLKVAKTSAGLYFLVYKNEYYRIEKTTFKKPLSRARKEYNMSESTSEKIAIRIKDIKAVTTFSDDLEVTITGSKTIPETYHFEKKNNSKHLVIDGDLNLDEVTVYIVNDNKKIAYFMTIGEKLFQLDKDNMKPKPLLEVSPLTNRTTRLFRERNTIDKKVIRIN